MVDTNEITGARLTSRVPSKEYKDNYDRIFGAKKEGVVQENLPLRESESLVGDKTCQEVTK